MFIRGGTTADSDVLVDLWLRSVRATHAFLSGAEIQALLPHVERYLKAATPALSVLCADSGDIMGFMGMSENKIDALFLDPSCFGSGGGRALIEHARAQHEELLVDVNEQNPGAVRFYEACGFTLIGRSELDDAGRPYPLLHMKFVPRKGL
jgi:putative acetyltransferase